MATQFGAVGYIITLYSSKKLCKKLGGPSKFWGGPDPLTCPVVVPIVVVVAAAAVVLVVVYLRKETKKNKSTQNKHTNKLLD